MKKKITAMILLVALLATSGLATKPLPSVYFSFQPKFPVRYAIPFHLELEWDFQPAPEITSLDITLPGGVELLKGDLHWGGKVVRDSMYHKDLLVQIKKPGVYEIAADFTASRLQDERFIKQFPIHETLFFYALEDTIGVFWDRNELKVAIRDSLLYPEVVARRYDEKEDSRMRAFRVKTNAQPYTLMFDLAYIANNAYVSLHTNFIWDANRPAKLSEHYSPTQIELIKKYGLLYTQPRIDLVEEFLDFDFHSTISDEKMAAMSVVLKRQLTELYELDQKIIHTEQTAERDSLISSRKSLLEKQTNERRAIVNKVEQK